MSVKKKIEKNEISEDALKYISQGAEVRADTEQKSKRTGLCIYIPVDFLALINRNLKKRVGISRNAWILEALQEKLERESHGISQNPQSMET